MKNIVCISIKGLYETYGSQLSCCRIEHKTEKEASEERNYYDLYNGPYLVCMDGEQCMVLREGEDMIELSNTDAEGSKTFFLSRDEFETAAFSDRSEEMEEETER